MAESRSQVGFWVRCSPADPSWALATPEGRRTYYRRVGELATAAYAADRARGVDRFGAKLAPLAPHTIKYRRSAMGPANKTAPAFIPAGSLSRTNAFIRRRPEEDGVWFFWRNDPRVRRSWGDVLYFHANGLVRGAPIRDVLGLSPRAQKDVARQANAWWNANKKRFTPGVVSPVPTKSGKVYIQARHVEAHTVGPKPIERNKRTGLYEGLYQYRGPQAPAPSWAVKAYQQAERKGLTTYSATPARLRKPEAMATLAALRPDESRKPKPKATAWPADPSKLEFVRKLGGSTGAELLRDPKSGRLFVRKAGATPDHIREECLADGAYQALGIKVPKFKLYETKNGPVKLAQFVDGKTLAELRSREPAAYQAALAKLQKGFAADVILGNWDVIGLAYDNIIVDAKGTPWRIDNGGALRFRAQGAKKTAEQWNRFPTELWSLRNSAANSQTAEAFSAITAKEWARQISAIAGKAQRLKLPSDVSATIHARLSELRHVAGRVKTLLDDRWVDQYADQLAERIMGIRKAGIVERMPAKLSRPGGKGVVVKDEHGNEWDSLRGKASLVEALAAYVNADGGGNYKAVEKWMRRQAGSSWSDLSQGLKYFLAKQRTLPSKTFYWKDGDTTAKTHFEEAARLAGGVEKYAASFQSLHAFTWELLDKVEFDGKDAQRGTVQLMRTENLDVMKLYGLKVGDRNVRIDRGALESTSIYTRVSVKGTELTIQHVPIHRILGTYWQELRPGGNQCAFHSNGENEFMAMLNDLPFDYVP